MKPLNRFKELPPIFVNEYFCVAVNDFLKKYNTTLFLNVKSDKTHLGIYLDAPPQFEFEDSVEFVLEHGKIKISGNLINRLKEGNSYLFYAEGPYGSCWIADVFPSDISIVALQPC